mmetsp:Transcript_30844/g.99487  ORF Transcript_30844/g.99487 Transcript_30844/m.99487 type:complete len:175 (+) Transcript_30844:119-643(+)
MKERGTVKLLRATLVFGAPEHAKGGPIREIGQSRRWEEMRGKMSISVLGGGGAELSEGEGGSERRGPRRLRKGGSFLPPKWDEWREQKGIFRAGSFFSFLFFAARGDADEGGSVFPLSFLLSSQGKKEGRTSGGEQGEQLKNTAQNTREILSFLSGGRRKVVGGGLFFGGGCRS